MAHLDGGIGERWRVRGQQRDRLQAPAWPQVRACNQCTRLHKPRSAAGTELLETLAFLLVVLHQLSIKLRASSCQLQHYRTCSAQPVCAEILERAVQ